jgi:solute carrier family 13 (sodium-dependent dicarboxylate transporter), member 2/3/5
MEQHKTSLWVWAGPVLAMVVGWLMWQSGQPQNSTIAAAITAWCVLWWLTEAVPIAVTSLLPIAIFPLLNVLSPQQVAQAYGSPLVLLMLGGCLLSVAMSSTGAHRRVAMLMVKAVGAKHPRHLVWGFMLAAAFLSMWISNTATALVLLPIAVAAVQDSNDKAFVTALFLGIAYACSIGGMATPIGTPPNLVFMQVYQQQTGTEVGFLQWMSWSMPVVLVLFPLAAWLLTRRLSGHIAAPDISLGPWRSEERRVLWVFAITALAWMTRTDPWGGWKTWFDLPWANDASVALLAVVLLFSLPKARGTSERLLSWQATRDVPWGVMLLFAGGLSIATAFKETGLSQMVAEQLAAGTSLPPVLMVLLVCLMVTFLTEVTSNTASASLLLPILAAAAVVAGIAPIGLMLPAVLSASCAFMLPIATPPNAVVFSSGYFTAADMAKVGWRLNILGAIVITAVMTIMGVV